MANQAARIEDLLDLLYLAAAERSAWADCLASLARLFEAQVGVFIAQRSGDARYAVGASIGIPGEMIRQYDEYYHALDPWFLARRARSIKPSVARGSDLCPPQRLKQSEFYLDFWKRSSCLHQAGMFHAVQDESAVVSLHRARTQPDFSRQDLRLLQRLFPHFRRALAVHRQSLDLHHSVSQVAAVVDALDVALIGLGLQRSIRFRNSAAEALLRAGDALLERNGCLVLSDSSAQAGLERLVSAATTRSLDTVAGGSLHVFVARRSLLVTVLPANSYAALGSEPLVALLSIIDLQAAPKSRSLYLSQLFGLTPAENRVVMFLLEGLDPSAIAARTGTTAGTVRFQLKAVYRKLGVTRQSQLVRLVSRIPGVADR